MSQSDHEKWNAHNYPGTLQLCFECDEPTGNCEDDSIYSKEGDPLCRGCYHKEPRPLADVTRAQKIIDAIRELIATDRKADIEYLIEELPYLVADMEMRE